MVYTHKKHQRRKYVAGIPKSLQIEDHILLNMGFATKKYLVEKKSTETNLRQN